MEHETILLILSFLIGWVGHAVYSFVFNFGRTSYLVKYVGYSTMCLAKLMSEQVVEFLEMKYVSLSQMGIEKNKVKIMRNEDRASVEHMQQMIVNVIQENYPKPFSHHIDFKNWNQMLMHISTNRRNDV